MLSRDTGRESAGRAPEEGRDSPQPALRRRRLEYLYWALMARDSGRPALIRRPEGLALRADCDVQRPDAGSGRLSAELSAEVCREYVEEGREVPELALRFNVSAGVVRSALTGASWSRHTDGLRPRHLRAEPRMTFMVRWP